MAFFYSQDVILKEKIIQNSIKIEIVLMISDSKALTMSLFVFYVMAPVTLPDRVILIHNKHLKIAFKRQRTLLSVCRVRVDNLDVKGECSAVYCYGAALPVYCPPDTQLTAKLPCLRLSCAITRTTCASCVNCQERTLSTS